MKKTEVENLVTLSLLKISFTVSWPEGGGGTAIYKVQRPLFACFTRGNQTIIETQRNLFTTLCSEHLFLVENTVKKAVELLDVPSRNTFLMLNKYNSTSGIFFRYPSIVVLRHTFGSVELFR